MIRPATPADATAICAIYNPYVLSTTITFEEQPVSVDEMAARIREVSAGLPWLVADDGGDVVGYAYATKWRARSAYRFTVESTVYVREGQVRRGLGRALYMALIAELRQRGVHGVIGGIALPNPASVALHEVLGFVPVARFGEVGWKFERWIDVGYWQLSFPPAAPDSAGIAVVR